MSNIDFHPYIVSAPLLAESAPSVDIDTIFIFDYKNSFKTSNNKPYDMIKYLESFGGIFDLMIDKNTLYKEKEQLLLNYFNSNSFFNCYSLTKTLIHILFKYRELDEEVSGSIFNDKDAAKFIKRNSMFLNELVKFYNSMFLIMLIYSSKMDRNIKHIRQKYPKERIIKDEFSPNVCNVLFEKQFYEYYKKGVGKDINYYEVMFEEGLYRGKTFLDVLINENNTLLPVMIDINNEVFGKFLKEQGL